MTNKNQLGQLTAAQMAAVQQMQQMQYNQTVATNTNIYYTGLTSIAGTAGTTIISAPWDTAISFGQVEGMYLQKIQGKIQIPKDQALIVELPDETCIVIDSLGNYRIDDKDAKVIYRANRIHEFNPYVNASDLLSRFIQYLGSLKLTKKEAARIPIALFINWLVIEAAKKDDDPIPEGIIEPISHPLLTEKFHPRCSFVRCRRFIRKIHSQQGFLFCNPQHAESQFAMIK